MNVLRVNGNIDKGKLAKELLIPVLGGMVTGMIATRRAKEKYSKLKKPDFSPPSWVFPVVWTGLYASMGLANYRVSMKKKPTATAEALYDIQLGLNFLWSFLFFRWNLRGTAFAEIGLLLGMITLTTYQYYQKDKIAGRLMLPYIAWVAYALKLNYSTWKLNQ
ncbi:TspO/MBR family protein [Mesobacillus selenatarsenatis]|uniref:Tryptophan-rich sensory protein n=1 Tax=Mesobacillus selenatarsenatis (strain DSM 18680 / JCM 14380 / FERM P-15431 / SF-1) TaxID=1321606 RepID=A0A0A8X1C6_MESS1|nr:TspO/MBR family protein [Mesobacillus selenatarsenatis]GAM13059.1 tryptophan-rich sensory protein [Mesobacillus selenatarsenatis SF-1]